MPFNISEAEAEAKKELAKEQGEHAKAKLKGKLKQIAAARAVVGNLEREYNALLLDIGSE